MPIYEVDGDQLIPYETSSFGTLQMRERQDLQRLLRDHIEVIDSDMLVIAEEFGSWEDANRRIDLLALDEEGRLVVVELKRTKDAGLADLQALRYAAMVSAMTFSDVEAAHKEYLTKRGSEVGDARTKLLDHVAADAETDEEHLSGEVRIVLVSQGFNRELTTTVLWLNTLEGMDIRCVQIEPYQIGESIFLDVQQTIPLPEAQDFQVRVRRKTAEQRAARTSNRDFSRFHIVVDGEKLPSENKRRSIRLMLQHLVDRGVDPAEVLDIIKPTKLHDLPGQLTEPDEVKAAFLSKFPEADVARYFLDTPFVVQDRTWVLSKMWGRNTRDTLNALHDRFPDLGVSWAEEG